MLLLLIRVGGKFNRGRVFLTETWVFIKSEISMRSVHLQREILASGRRQRNKKTNQKAAEEFICQVVDEIPPQSLVQGAGQIQSVRVAHG